MIRTRLMALVFCAPLLSGSYWPMTNDSDVAAGQKAFERGNYAAAVTSFREALRGKGSRARLHFDLGTALVRGAMTLPEGAERSAQLDTAIVSLRLARSNSQGELRERVHYNLGNALLLRGQIDEAIASYRKVLRDNSDHDDARHNLELALLVRRSVEGEAIGEALRHLGAIPSSGEAGAGAEQGESGGHEGQAEASEGMQSGASASGDPIGEEGAGTSENAGDADAAGEDAEDGQGTRPDSRKRPLPRGNGRFSLEQKLDALERRSGELRRANMFQKTESRLRTPDKKRRDQ